MSYQLVMHQTATDPAEYLPDSPFTCARCNFHGDRDHDTVYDAADGPVCRECLMHCVDCGELVEGEDSVSDSCWFDDEPWRCDLCFGNILCPSKESQ
jgi:hypothetical protein